ncbi:MAG: c-type cytochrome biogenesis protein CcsB, partial [Glutamicibacter sp.]
MDNAGALAPINETLGEYSQLFMLLAAMVYGVVFIIFALDLAKTNKSISEMDSEALKRDEELLVSAGGAVGTKPRSRRGAAVRADNVGEHIVTDKMEYTQLSAKRPTARIAVVLMWLAAALHGGAVVSRAIAAHRVPWGNMYEFLSTG